MTPVAPESQTASNGYPNDEIDLRQLAHVLWQRRISIIVIAVLGAALGVGASVWLTKYRSEGLFLTPGLTVGNYKTFESAMANKPRLEQFLALTEQAETAAGKLMLDMIDKSTGLQEAVQPTFAFTDKDAKAYGVKLDEAAIVGLRLTLDEAEPSGASPVRLLGEYVRDTKIKLDLEGHMRAECHQHSTQEQALRNAQIADEFEISQLHKRADILRDAIKRYPNSALIDSRQIVLLEKGGERYLSPEAQLVAMEISIANMRLAENERARSRIAAGIRKAYYCQGRDALQKPVTGRAFLETLEEIHRAAFAGQDAAVDIVEATANELAIERANWNNGYLAGMRFVTSPEGAETRVRKPGFALGLVLGGMLGGMFGVLLAFLRAWWRDNRAVVVAEDA